MRTAYQEQLDNLMRSLLKLVESATENLELATEALLGTDATAAERIISFSDQFATDTNELDQQAFELLALQNPVASDLRRVVSSMNTLSDVRRMAIISLRIADIARARNAAQVLLPQPALGLVQEMAEFAINEGHKTAKVLKDLDVRKAQKIAKKHSQMAELRSQVDEYVQAEDCPLTPAQAADLVILAHSYDTFGDYAVEASQRAIYLVTGEAILWSI